jgi:HSP20 family protein
MTVGRWDPFQNVAALQDRINRLFEDAFPHARSEDELASCAWRPTVDIYEAVDGVIIVADLPGVRKEDVSVEVKDNILTLKGERKGNDDVGEDQYYRRERCCGNFHRAFTLQHTVMPDKIKATFKDGVLKVLVPHPEEEKPKQIQVNID